MKVRRAVVVAAVALVGVANANSNGDARAGTYGVGARMQSVTTLRCGIGVRRAPDPQRTRYDIVIDADPARSSVTGSLSARFTPDLDTDRLVLRLWPNGERRRDGPTLDVTALSVDGEGGRRIRRPDPTTLEVSLGRTVAAGTSIDIALRFTLAVPGGADERWSRAGGTLRLGTFHPVLAWESGRGWNTTPPTTARGEAAMTPVASYRLTVRTRPGLTVLGTGSPAPGTIPGETVFTADAVRDVAVSIGTFRLASAVVDDVGPAPVNVTVGVAQGIDEQPERYLRRVVAALRDLSRRFGPAPYPWYTLAITPVLRGGIEFPGHVMQGPGSSGRSTPHEVAHQWFYALVGNDQGRDPWIDEGLASWAEARVEGTLTDFGARAIPADARGRAGAPMTFWDRHGAAYYRGVYVQTVQALAGLGAPDEVDCALAELVAGWAHQVVSRSEVLAALEARLPGSAALMTRQLGPA